MYEIILIVIGIVLGFIISWYIISKQKWGDKASALNAKWEKRAAEFNAHWEKKFSETEKEYSIKLERLEKDWKVKYIEDIEEMKRLFKESEKTIRQKSVSSSRRTLVGKFIEKFVPFLSKIPFLPADMHFLGQPVDYIVFEGLGENKIKRVTFLEVKTGKSKLTPREKSLKDTIESRRVRWQEVRVDTSDEETPDKEIHNEEESIGELYDNIDKKLKEVRGGHESEKSSDKRGAREIKTQQGVFNISLECPHCKRDQSYLIEPSDVEVIKKEGQFVQICKNCNEEFGIDERDLENPNSIHF